MNKLENTLDNKARFFALYFGQYVLKIIDNEHPYVVSGDGSQKRLLFAHLELKSLAHISDEDCKHLGKYLDWFGMDDSGVYVEDVEEFKKHLINQGFDWDYYGIKNGIYVGDYLRSKGYALPFMGLSVDDQVSYGWVKLRKGGGDE